MTGHYRPNLICHRGHLSQAVHELPGAQVQKAVQQTIPVSVRGAVLGSS